MTTVAPAPTAEKSHQIQATLTPQGEVRFALPFNPQFIENVEAIDLDLLLITASGEKYILQQGALLAVTSSDSKLIFNNGDTLLMADQMKRMGVMKPVEGGSFRLAHTESMKPTDTATDNSLELNSKAQDTAAKIETLLQSLEKATQSATNSDAPHVHSTMGHGKPSARSATADPLASAAPGAPPSAVDVNTNTSNIKVNSTTRAFTGNSDSAVSDVWVTQVGNVAQTPEKKLDHVDFSSIDIHKTIHIRMDSQTSLHVEMDGKANATLLLPGVLNATRLVLTSNSSLPAGFTINGQSFTNGEVTIDGLTSLNDVKLAVGWTVGSNSLNDFSIAVKFYDGATPLDYGNAPLNFYHSNTLPTEFLDSNSNPKLFLSSTGFSYTITGTIGNDSIAGGSGHDTLDGGLGNDTMAGGAGDDTYIVDNTSDTVTEAVSAGTDTVQSAVNYTLGAHLENLTLTGATATIGTGNELN
nr:hypothetical protein [Comamonadaceae bacterium]